MAVNSYIRQAAPVNYFAVFDYDSDKMALETSNKRLLQVYYRNEFLDSSDSQVFIAETEVQLYVHYDTSELFLVVGTKSITSPNFLGESEITNYDLGITLETGLNRLVFQGAPYYGPAFSTESLWNQVTAGFKPNLISLQTPSGIYTTTVDTWQTSTGTVEASPDIAKLDTNTHHIGSTIGTQTYWTPITVSAVSDFQGVGILCDGVSGCDYGWTILDTDGYYIPQEYITDYFFVQEDYFSLIDKYRDIALLPSSNWGKNILVEGGVVPLSYTDKYLTVAGPKGPAGPVGAEGPEGPEGPSFLDGGTWDTIYQPDQIIDGGPF